MASAQQMARARIGEEAPMSLKVVGAGFGRTGTLSMKAALEQLGLGPCYHMAEVIAHPPFVIHWMEAAEGRDIDWDVVFAGYGATVDWPACSFWRELAGHYRDAKVILTVRDLDTWFDSCQATIFNVMKAPPEALPPGMTAIAAMTRTLIRQKTFGDRLDDRSHCLAVHRAHIEDVKRTIPSGRLLVFDVKEGWEPLCAFLGVSVPGTPFPRVNERENFGRDISAASGRP